MKRLLRLLFVLLVMSGTTGLPVAAAGFCGGAAGAWLVVLSQMFAASVQPPQPVQVLVTQRQASPEWVRVVEMEGGGGIVVLRQIDGRLTTRYYRVLA